MAEKGKLSSGPALTVDDLQSSPKLQGKNLLDLAKSQKVVMEDTFTLSQSGASSTSGTQLQASGDSQGASVISILKKKPPASPSVFAQSQSEKKVNFHKEQISPPDPKPADPISALPETEFDQVPEKLHKDCPTCTCHLKESSLKTVSMLQSIPEKPESESSELHSVAFLSSHASVLDPSKASLHFVSKLQSQGLTDRPQTHESGFSPLGQFIPLSMRTENSPSRIFRARLNRRLMKNVGKYEEYKVPDAVEAYKTTLLTQGKTSILQSGRSGSSGSLTSLSFLP
jgi:hypothetical protein